MDSICWHAFWQFMLVNWKDEAVFLVQEAMPVAFWKPVCGIGVASPQFISIKVGFSVHANVSEKLLSDRKKYSIKKGSLGNPSFWLRYNLQSSIWVSRLSPWYCQFLMQVYISRSSFIITIEIQS